MLGTGDRNWNSIWEMPYFILLPLYALYLLALFMLGAVLLFVPKLRSYASFVFAAAFGSLPGFIVANVVLVVFSIIVLDLPAPKSIQTVQAIFIGATIFIGPFIVSTAGVLLGSLVGVGVMWRLKRNQRGVV